MARTSTATGGGGGSIGGSISVNQVAFGTGTDTIGGSAAFMWSAASYVLEVYDSSSELMISLNGALGTFQLGGFASGTQITGDDATGDIDIRGLGVFSITHATKNILAFDPASGGTYSYGDLGSQFGDSHVILDDTNASFFYEIGHGNRYLLLDVTDKTYEIGDINNTNNNTFISVRDDLSTIYLNGTVSARTNFIQDVLDPVLAQDAATKAYVDTFVTGLSWKNAVAAATTAALATNVYANGAAGIGATLTGFALGALGNIDGYSPIVGDRILVKDEVATSHNGVYTVTTLGSAGVFYVLTRATDNDQTAEMVSATVSVTNGTVNGNTAFTQVTPTPIMGTDPIIWNMFLNGTYTAGAGLTLTGHSFSLNTSHANDWLAKQTFESGMFELAGLTSGFFRMNSADTSTTYSVKMPPAQGTALTFLQNDGAGNLSWVAGVSSLSIDALTAATLRTITDAANFVYNGNNGTIQTITLGANRTFTVTNLKVGVPYTFIVKQDATGGRVLTWGTTVKVAFTGAGVPPISSAASAVDKYSFVSDGTTIFTDYGVTYT